MILIIQWCSRFWYSKSQINTSSGPDTASRALARLVSGTGSRRQPQLEFLPPKWPNIPISIRPHWYMAYIRGALTLPSPGCCFIPLLHTQFAAGTLNSRLNGPSSTTCSCRHISFPCTSATWNYLILSKRKCQLPRTSNHSHSQTFVSKWRYQNYDRHHEYKIDAAQW